jgi:hypothetical protein
VYGNECFLSLSKVARDTGRTQRTVDRNIATLIRRGLLILRSAYKFFRRPDGSTYKKAVVIKDFSGLYALAHEYDEWLRSDEYLEASWEYLELIRQDPHLVAKLCRFENYRRLLDRQREPFLHLVGDPRFTQYREEPLSGSAEMQAKDAELDLSCQDTTKLVSKDATKCMSKVSKERINKKVYDDNLNGDSSDSGENAEVGREASAPLGSGNKLEAQDYTKQGRGEKTSILIQNESTTNRVSPPQENIPPGACKRRENAEMHPNVRKAKQAMAAAGFASRRSARRQVEELPPPAKHPLARSFLSVICTPLGDKNEKGSKTGIERHIETFELGPQDVVLCLVRAFVEAKKGKVRRENIDPQTGIANRMKLYCYLFKEFARARASGSKWEYTWEQMRADLEADDLFAEWLVDHQAELAGEVGDQAGIAQSSLSTLLGFTDEGELAGRDGNGEDGKQETAAEPSSGVEAQELPSDGWEWREEACACADYLAEELAANEYVGLVIKVRLPEGGTRYQIFVLETDSWGYRLLNEKHVDAIVTMARNRTLFAEVERDREAGD